MKLQNYFKITLKVDKQISASLAKNIIVNFSRIKMYSEEALNGIFNILDTMVNQHEEKKKETLWTWLKLRLIKQISYH